jgi:esterase/lipase superfamily enzyme
MSGSWYSNFPDAKHVTSEKTLSGAFEKWLAISCHKSDASNKANGELLEAVVFVPGFNNYLKQGSETFGQLLALSSWPKHLVPFQFNWPGGSLLSYIAAQEVAASEQLATAFEGFLNEVHALPNVSRVHIIAHSMGCRFVLVGRCTHA